jgi:hypothetical protein
MIGRICVSKVDAGGLSRETVRIVIINFFSSSIDVVSSCNHTGDISNAQKDKLGIGV